MKHFALLLAFVLCASTSMAKSIDETAAFDVARTFFLQLRLQLSATSSSSRTLQLATHTAAYYVYNRGTNAGYVVVAADDAAVPVLGYAEVGHFTPAAIPENMRWWLSEYERELAAASTVVPRPTTTSTTATSTANRTAIAPLLTTKWGQGSPYNLNCPSVSGTRCPTGCVATAMAQIMRYHQWPAQGRGSKAYAWKNGKTVLDTLRSDFSQHTYNWSAMTNTYDVTSSEASKTAVAQLMSDVGIASEMDYAVDGSGAPSTTAMIALQTYFDYDKAAILYDRDCFSRAEWEQMCYDELAAGRPLYYSGYNAEAGHAFVCDGYSDGYFHINWGWDGMSDGYFRLSALDPESQGIGGSSAGYNMSQCASFGLRPAQEGSTYTPYMACNTEFRVSPQKATHTTTVAFTGNFVNGGLGTLSVAPGIKITDEMGKNTYIASTTNYTLKPQYSYKYYEVAMTNFPTADGLYTVRPAYYDTETATWHDTSLPYGNPQYYLQARVSGDNITFAHPADVRQLNVTNFVADGKAYVGKSLKFTATMSADSCDYFGYVYALMATPGYKVYQYSDYTLIDLVEGETQTYEFSITVPDSVTTYSVWLYDADGNPLGSPISVTSEALPTGTVALSLTAAPVVTDADNVDANNFRLDATVACTSGYYDGTFWVLIYEAGSYDNYVAYLWKTGVEIGAGETRTLTFAGAVSALEEGKTYVAYLCYLSEKGYTDYIINSKGSSAASFTVAISTGIDATTVSTASPHAIEIYNAAGALVDRQLAATPDLSRLAAGVYIVREGAVTHKVLKK